MERIDADVVVLLRGQIPQVSDIDIFLVRIPFASPAYRLVLNLPKKLQNALGGLSEVIFNPERRGGLGIVVLATGQTTPTSLAQFERLAKTYVCRPLHLIITDFFPP